MSQIVHELPGRDEAQAHALALVQELGASSGVHLDLGCGGASLAHALQQRGLTYVGIGEEPQLSKLLSQGLELHAVDLHDTARLAERLKEVLAGRRLASVTLLGVLARLPDNPAVLRAVRALAEGSSAPLVLSVANLAHRDIAFRLMTGRWACAEAELQDEPPLIHHTAGLVDRLAAAAGFRQTAQKDVRAEQAFGAPIPADSVALSPQSQLNQYLRKLRDQCEPTAGVTWLVRGFLPATQPAASPAPAGGQRPFLTVLMRTQGRRPGTLRDALLCLEGQSSTDFELILIAHKVTGQQRAVVEKIYEDLPDGLRSRTTLLRVDHGNRTVPLNIGFERARGSYVSVLDDDDVVLSHWVETFQDLARTAMGKVLRAVAVEQDIEEREWKDGTAGYRTVGGLRRLYPSNYDLYAHLTQNFTPPMCLSFPRQAFHELGLRFDEELDTCEDWDFEMRCVLLCGVAASPQFTSIYRRWKTGHASHTEHGRDVWLSNDARIVARLNEQAHVFPPGTVKVIRDQLSWIRKLESDIIELKRALHPSHPAYLPPPPESSGRPLRYEIADGINGAVKRLPVIHPLLRASFGRFKGKL